MPASEAERLFNDAHNSFESAQDGLVSFRLVAIAGLKSEAGRPLLANYQRSLVAGVPETYVQADPEAVKVLSQLQTDASIALSVSRREANVVLAVDVACLLFAHIFFDNFVSQLCTVASTARPQFLAERLRDRKIPLSAVASTSYAEILAATAKEHLSALDREALAKRIQFLFSICQPPAGFQPVQAFTFDLPEIERIDRLRQTVVHQADFRACPVNIDEVVTFLGNSAEYLAHMVAGMGLELSLSYLHQWMRQRAGA